MVSGWESTRVPRVLEFPSAMVTCFWFHLTSLEFLRVIVAGIGELKDAETDVPEQVRLLYVAMTRAQEALLLTASNENCYVKRFLAVG